MLVLNLHVKMPGMSQGWRVIARSLRRIGGVSLFGMLDGLCIQYLFREDRKVEQSSIYNLCNLLRFLVADDSFFA